MNCPTVGRPSWSNIRSFNSVEGFELNRMGRSLRKPKSCVPWPMSKVSVASRLPVVEEYTARIRYSSSSPERVGVRGCLSNVPSSSHRSSMSLVVICVGSGSLLPVLLTNIGPFDGLLTRNGAVTPASLCTLIRKALHPFCCKCAFPFPALTLTRLSGLIWTSANVR